MKVTKITLHYTEKRSAAYQTAEFGAAVEVELQEGETASQAFEKYQKALVQKVTESTSNEVVRIAEEAAQLNAQYAPQNNRRG